MARVIVNCKNCDYRFQNEVLGDCEIICPRCGLIYVRRYVGDGMYEIKLKELNK